MRKHYLFEEKKISDEEILDKLPEDQIKKIEDLLKKATKDKDIDLEEVAQKEDETKKSEEKNEALGVTGVIAIASLIPLLLEAGGSIANLVNRTFGLKFTKEQFAQFRFLKKVLASYRMLVNRNFCDLTHEGKTYRYSWSGGGGGKGEKWTELGKKADEILKKLGWSGDPQIYYQSGLKKDLTKKESFHQFGHLKTFENYVNEEWSFFGPKTKSSASTKWKDKRQTSMDKLKPTYGDYPKKSVEPDKKRDDMILSLYKKGKLEIQEIAKQAQVPSQYVRDLIQKQDDKNWDQAQKLFGDKHDHEVHRYDSSWEPTYTKEDGEFVENEIDRIEEMMKINLPIDTEIGNKLKSMGHKLHAAYTYPIRLFLKGVAWAYNWKWMKDKENRTVAANIIYAAGMVWFTGAQVYEKLSHLKGMESYGQLIVKNYKTGKSFKEFVEGVMEIWQGKG